MLLNGGELDGQRVLQPGTVREMTEDQLPEGVGPISLFGLPLPGIQFGLGVAVVTGKVPLQARMQPGDYFWAGVATTHFWVSPREELIVIALTQKMPLTLDLQSTVPSLVHAALTPRP
jgi:CubicO group peptidase (beta-lactamase class C family)